MAVLQNICAALALHLLVSKHGLRQFPTSLLQRKPFTDEAIQSLASEQGTHLEQRLLVLDVDLESFDNGDY